MCDDVEKRDPHLRVDKVYVKRGIDNSQEIIICCTSVDMNMTGLIEAMDHIQSFPRIDMQRKLWISPKDGD